MELWQYNAWCEAYRARQDDELVIQVQAAYLCAYWNGFSKHKKSLDSVLRSIQKKHKKIKREPIDLEKVSEEFNKMEDLRRNGYEKRN